MRAHTASGTGRVLGLASEPTAAWFVGNLIRGSAPASGTGASLVLAGVVARAGDGVFVLAAVAVVGAGVEGVVLALGALDVDRAARVELLAVLAPGESALQAARARLVRAAAHGRGSGRSASPHRWPPSSSLRRSESATDIHIANQSSGSVSGSLDLVLQGSGGSRGVRQACTYRMRIGRR